MRSSSLVSHSWQQATHNLYLIAFAELSLLSEQLRHAHPHVPKCGRPAIPQPQGSRWYWHHDPHLLLSCSSTTQHCVSAASNARGTCARSIRLQRLQPSLNEIRCRHVEQYSDQAGNALGNATRLCAALDGFAIRNQCPAVFASSCGTKLPNQMPAVPGACDDRPSSLVFGAWKLVIRPDHC